MDDCESPNGKLGCIASFVGTASLLVSELARQIVLATDNRTQQGCSCAWCALSDAALLTTDSLDYAQQHTARAAGDPGTPPRKRRRRPVQPPPDIPPAFLQDDK